MIRERIKTETTTQHKSLEAISYSTQLAHGTLSVDQYTQLIRFNYAMNASFEATWGDLPFDLPAELQIEKRGKVDGLRRDLNTLGIAVDQIDIPDWPQRFDNFAQFMGALYVIEGSTLGGAVIHKMLSQNEALEDCQPFHFYQGYGRETGLMWKGFLDQLKTITQPDQEDICVQSAQECFNLMEEWMKEERNVVPA